MVVQPGRVQRRQRPIFASGEQKIWQKKKPCKNVAFGGEKSRPKRFTERCFGASASLCRVVRVYATVFDLAYRLTTNSDVAQQGLRNAGFAAQRFEAFGNCGFRLWRGTGAKQAADRVVLAASR